MFFQNFEGFLDELRQIFVFSVVRSQSYHQYLLSYYVFTSFVFEHIENR
jgi:hypothetical protein